MYRAKNIEYKSLKITGGSALIVLGLAVFFLLDFLLGLIGAGGVNPWVRYGIGGVLILAGIVWFFRQGSAPAGNK